VTSFFPDRVQENTILPNIVLTSFRIVNREAKLPTVIEECDHVEVSHNDNVLTFEFAALDFANPSKNQYAYKMEGFDKDWNWVGSQQTATYTNLDPGDYTLRIIGSNDDGAWNEKGTTLTITVRPPFWKTWWFRLIALVSFLSASGGIYYLRIRALTQKNILQQEFSRRLIESQEAERKRIAAELHDSVGQDLLILKNKILLNLQPKQGAKSLRSELSQLVKHVTRSLKDVRAISRNLRPVQLDQLGLTAALEAVIETVGESSHLKTVVRLDDVDNLLEKDGEINLFRIVQESLNNVLKHSGASNLTIELKKEKTYVRLSIEDDGGGIKATRSAEGLGFSTMNERARILGATLRIEPREPGGTRVLLVVPLPKEPHD
jgi:signal transduction histidine kinase